MSSIWVSRYRLAFIIIKITVVCTFLILATRAYLKKENKCSLTSVILVCYIFMVSAMQPTLSNAYSFVFFAFSCSLCWLWTWQESWFQCSLSWSSWPTTSTSSASTSFFARSLLCKVASCVDARKSTLVSCTACTFALRCWLACLVSGLCAQTRNRTQPC